MVNSNLPAGRLFQYALVGCFFTLFLLTDVVHSQDFRGFGSRGSDSGGRPSFGGGRPDFGGGRPSFGGGGSDFGGGRPSFGGGSGFGEGRPSFGSGGSGFGGGRPSFGGGGSGFGGGQPSFGGGRPSFGGGGMSFGGGGPDSGGGRPSFGGDPRSSGDSSDRSSRFAAMMDRNGDGRFDQEEIDRMPSFVRDMMQSRGIELRAGMTVDQMRNSMSGGGNDPNRPDDNRGRSQGPQPYKMKPKAPVTLQLPPKYAEYDADLDGQVAMYEWMMSRRADLDQFDQIDTDFDGLLTPAELLAADSATTNAASTFPARQRLTIVGAPSSRGRPGENNSAWGGRGGQDSRENSDPAETARSYFSRLDSDGDGRLSSAEWERSRRTRGMFEEAGIRLENMSVDEFTQNYVRLSATAAASSGGDNRGGRGGR
jgi:hypothetical protein